MTSYGEQKRSAAYSRAANKAKLLELVGFDTVTFETDDGEVFYFPHPLMYDKATKAALKPLADDDSAGIVRILFDGVPDTDGYTPGNYDRFIEHDGDPDDVMETAQLVAVASQRAVREGRPMQG